jgi:hypothetical protein
VIPEDEIEDVEDELDGAEEPTPPDASIAAAEPPTADDRR